jgi:hypothetical protein
MDDTFQYELLEVDHQQVLDDGVDKDLDAEANEIDPNGIDAILGADRATPAGGDGGGVAGGTT